MLKAMKHSQQSIYIFFLYFRNKDNKNTNHSTNPLNTTPLTYSEPSEAEVNEDKETTSSTPYVLI